MSITSVLFFAFLLFGCIVYYLTPKRFQWVILLLLSLMFYHFMATDYTILFPLSSAALAYLSSNLLRLKAIADSPKAKKYAAVVAVAAVLLNILIWFLVKGSSFWILTTNLLHRLFPSLQPLGALPVSYTHLDVYKRQHK